MQERRIDDRLLCAELVEVTWEESLRQQRRVANLEDISPSGLCLHMEKPIAIGTRVGVRYGRGEFVGSVRYCLFREIGYFLGIEFGESSRWSTEYFRPQHLLNPCEVTDIGAFRRLD